MRQFDLPTSTFPYKIPHRLQLLSVPKKQALDLNAGLPPFTEFRVRTSALSKRMVKDRVIDLAYPSTRKLCLLKRMYRPFFPHTRNERISKLIELSNATCYTKLTNTVLDLKKQADSKGDSRKKKGWSESEWKKHMEYINAIAGPRAVPETGNVDRGPIFPQSELTPHLTRMTYLPDHKFYRRESQEAWYKNPMLVPRAALKYEISERTKALAKPREVPTE